LRRFRRAAYNTKMTARKLLFPLGLALLALGLTACDTGRKAPPKTEVRVLNAVPRYTSLIYRRVESAPTSLDFKTGNVFTYDEDTYTLNVDSTNILNGAPERILSFSQKVLSGTTYTVVLYDAGTTIDRVVLETPTLPRNATDVEVQAVHVGKDLPPVDFYLTPPGTDLLATAPLGTLGFLQQVAPRRMPAGLYVITVTAPGNPAAVLFKSSQFNLDASKSISFSITPDAGSTNAPFSVVAFGDVSNPFFNVNAPGSLRVVSAPADRLPRDIAIDSQFSPPLFAAVPFATETAYGDVRGDQTPVKVNVTPAGNPGTLEVDATLPFTATILYTIIVGGNPGALTYSIFVDDNRRDTQWGKLRLYSGVTQIPLVTFFLLDPGTDISTGVPIASLAAPGGSEQIPLPPGKYDLVLQDLSTSTTVAGPIPITINAGGLYGVLATNNANGVSVDVTLLDELK
jgi:hypothetical protein